MSEYEDVDGTNLCDNCSKTLLECDCVEEPKTEEQMISEKCDGSLASCDCHYMFDSCCSKCAPQTNSAMLPELKGWWPEDCKQRAFVDGAKWWQFYHNGSTMFGSERDAAAEEAERRYGKVEPINKTCPVCYGTKLPAQHGDEICHACKSETIELPPLPSEEHPQNQYRERAESNYNIYMLDHYGIKTVSETTTDYAIDQTVRVYELEDEKAKLTTSLAELTKKVNELTSRITAMLINLQVRK